MPALHEGRQMMGNFTEDILWVHHGMWTTSKDNSELVKDALRKEINDWDEDRLAWLFTYSS